MTGTVGDVGVGRPPQLEQTMASTNGNRRGLADPMPVESLHLATPAVK
jgi:hypothetical protein